MTVGNSLSGIPGPQAKPAQHPPSVYWMKAITFFDASNRRLSTRILTEAEAPSPEPLIELGAAMESSAIKAGMLLQPDGFRRFGVAGFPFNPVQVWTNAG